MKAIQSRKLKTPINQRVNLSIPISFAKDINDAAKANKMSFCTFVECAIDLALETDMACYRHNSRIDFGSEED